VVNNVTNIIYSCDNENAQENIDITNKSNVSDKEIIEGTPECEYDYTNGYYVEITEFNDTKQVITSTNSDFKYAREVYNFIREEFNTKVKSVALIKYFNGIKSNHYIKIFNNQPFQCDNFFKLISETIDQLEVMKNYINSINIQLSVADKSIDVLEHLIECSNYEINEDIERDFTRLKAALAARREVKNLKYLVDQITYDKILPYMNRINIKSERIKLNQLKSKLDQRISEGKNNWTNINNKINIVKFANDEEKEKVYKELKSRYSCVRVDEYNMVAAGYDLIYK